MQVKLKKEDFQAMAAHAVAHLPEEACGLIAGEKTDTERVIKKVYYLTNIDHTNEHFSLDPKEQLAAIKDMRKNGLEPLGNWHSHPETPAGLPRPPELRRSPHRDNPPLFSACSSHVPL